MPKTSVKSEYSLIRLILQKKYNAVINESNATDKNQRSITLFGYYDRLIYENIDNWSPWGLETLTHPTIPLKCSAMNIRYVLLHRIGQNKLV